MAASIGCSPLEIRQMSGQKKKAKKKLSKEDLEWKLCDAAAAYINAHGGNALMSTGIQIQTWPDSAIHEFVIGIKIIGRPPVKDKSK